MIRRRCPQCDREFPSERAKNIHQSRGCEKDYHSKETLQRLYHDEGLSAEEIAEKYDVTQTTIYNYLRDHGIEVKSPRNDPTHPPHHRLRHMKDRALGTCNETIHTTIDGDQYMVMIHRLVAVAHGKLDPAEFWNKDLVVHHKSQHGFDNRPDNLEVLEKSDHRERHGNDTRYAQLEKQKSHA